MIKASDLITAFQGYLAAGDGYIPNTSGETWTAEKQAKATSETVIKYGSQWIGHRVEDCSGAFVRGYKAHGLTIYHGSNRIAREYVVSLLPASAAKPGMAAFKAYSSGEKYYSLPEEYRPGHSHYNGDILDYYHIGLVDSDPAYVINAASTKSGVKRSKLADGWCAVGYLKAVSYNSEEKPMETKQMIVTAESGKTVNMRQGPGKCYPVVCAVPIGSVVTGNMESDGWAFIHYKGQSGYMQSQFLVDAPESLEAPDTQPVMPTNDEIMALVYKAVELNDQLQTVLDQLQIKLSGAIG